MAYPSRLLNENEEVVLDLRPHWWFLTPRLAALVGAVAVGIYAMTTEAGWFQALAGLLVLGVLIWFGLRYSQWITTNFVVTSERIIYRSGVLSKRGIETPLDRIDTVVSNQSVFERVIGAGDLEIQSAGETPSTFSDIRKPAVVQSEIYKQAEAHEGRKHDRMAKGMSGGGAAALSVAEQLEKLEGMRDRGTITAEQFEAQKAELLGDGA